jgi:nuclear receptor subfamily 2 group E protein 1
MPLDVAPLLANAGITSETASPEKLIKIMTEMRNFQEIINKFKQAQVDPTEFACLKAITLFKTTLSNKLEQNEYSSPSSSSSSYSSSSTSSLDNSILNKQCSTSCHPKDLQSIISFQDQTQLTLSKYDATAYPTQPFRFGKLLLLLPALRTVSAQTIEELFFKKTIGNISIERVILDMYKSPMANI